jgi:hypothetical protein
MSGDDWVIRKEFEFETLNLDDLSEGKWELRLGDEKKVVHFYFDGWSVEFIGYTI